MLRDSRSGRSERRVGRAIQLLLLLVCVMILVNALVGDAGLLQMLRARRDAQTLTASIEALKQQNRALHARARQLREDPAALEELARQDLGLIRAGEIVVVLKTVPSTAVQRP